MKCIICVMVVFVLFISLPGCYYSEEDLEQAYQNGWDDCLFDGEIETIDYYRHDEIMSYFKFYYWREMRDFILNDVDWLSEYFAKHPGDFDYVVNEVQNLIAYEQGKSISVEAKEIDP